MKRLLPWSATRAHSQARGVAIAFAEVLAHPPSSSYEIMNPRIWLEHGEVPSITMPDLHPLLDPEFAPYDLGVMGELDVRILAHILGGEAAMDKLTPNWAGGVYYAAQRRSASPAEQLTTGSITLVYESHWRTREAARAFANFYALGLHHKYATIQRRTADEASADEQLFTTDEGDALILTSGHSVFIAEGLPVALARQVAALFTVPETSSVQLRARLTPRQPALHEPTLTLTRLLPTHLSSLIRQ